MLTRPKGAVSSHRSSTPATAPCFDPITAQRSGPRCASSVLRRHRRHKRHPRREPHPQRVAESQADGSSLDSTPVTSTSSSPPPPYPDAKCTSSLALTPPSPSMTGTPLTLTERRSRIPLHGPSSKQTVRLGFSVSNIPSRTWTRGPDSQRVYEPADDVSWV